ncbi:MAG: putative GNAT family N-acyltransferase [Ascidiaceihabitans sp.]|jgi:predicted GNAT family N-acyltransferase
MTVEISLTHDIEACLSVRRIVFIQEQGVSEAEEIDGLDAEALHILAVVDGVPMGTARLIIDGAAAKIGRVCVLSEQRGTGLGAAIMRNALEVCKSQKTVNRALLGSQVHALKFYEQLGFNAFGPIYLDAGIEHRDMEIAL